MLSHDAKQAGRLALLEAAVLAVLRGAQEDGFDGLNIEASADDGETVIDLSYTAKGVAVAGEAL